MENIEVLKLVKRKHNDSYRPVLDLSLVNDIKNYSGWGKSKYLYDLFMVLRIAKNLNLIRNDEKKINFGGHSAEIVNYSKILIKYYDFKLEMPIDKFFKFYDEYNRLIREKAHEIILLRLEMDEITVKGIWYSDDSPFNKKIERKILRLTKLKGSYFVPMYVDDCLKFIIDRDNYGGELQTLYYVMKEFSAGLNIGIKQDSSKGFAIKYYQYVKNNADKLIDEDVFLTEDGYNLEFKGNNKILIQVWNGTEREYFDLFEINLDTFYEAYIQYLELKEQNPLPDEILFIKENEKINIEGIWYKDKENKKEKNYIKN